MTIKLIKKIKFKQLSLTKIKILVEEKDIIMIGHIGKKIGLIDSDNKLILDAKLKVPHQLHTQVLKQVLVSQLFDLEHQVLKRKDN